jgi:hypothetical protein
MKTPELAELTASEMETISGGSEIGRNSCHPRFIVLLLLILRGRPTAPVRTPEV